MDKGRERVAGAVAKVAAVDAPYAQWSLAGRYLRGQRSDPAYELVRAHLDACICREDHFKYATTQKHTARRAELGTVRRHSLNLKPKIPIWKPVRHRHDADDVERLVPDVHSVSEETSRRFETQRCDRARKLVWQEDVVGVE
jgi:hypothetical protein